MTSQPDLLQPCPTLRQPSWNYKGTTESMTASETQQCQQLEPEEVAIRNPYATVTSTLPKGAIRNTMTRQRQYEPPETSTDHQFSTTYGFWRNFDKGTESTR